VARLESSQCRLERAIEFELHALCEEGGGRGDDLIIEGCTQRHVGVEIFRHLYGGKLVRLGYQVRGAAQLRVGSALRSSVSLPTAST
jgi:TATA-binding protein-associated factor Taf7